MFNDQQIIKNIYLESFKLQYLNTITKQFKFQKYLKHLKPISKVIQTHSILPQKLILIK